MNIYTNTHDLPELTIKTRMFPVDPHAIAFLFQSPIRDENDTIIGYRNRVGIASSILTSAQIINSLATPITVTELAALERANNARMNAKAIPDWASWSEAEVLAWGNTNIGTPLANARTSLNAMSSLTLATFKSAMTIILNILDKMWVLQKANSQLALALRDEIWPNLQNV